MKLNTTFSIFIISTQGDSNLRGQTLMMDRWPGNNRSFHRNVCAELSRNCRVETQIQKRDMRGIFFGSVIISAMFRISVQSFVNQ